MIVAKYKKEELKKLQDTLYGIMEDVVKLCDKHHLTYFLAGGTALGAIRHSGFIPWDDDIDLIMARDDYEKFIQIAIDELGDKYFLDYYKTNKYYHKHHLTIRLNNTTFATEGYEKRVAKGIHQGIYLDILPLDYIKSRTSKKTFFDVVMIRSIEYAIRFKCKIVKFKLLKYKFITLPLSLLPRKLLHKMQYRYCMKDDDKKRDYLIEYCAIKHNYRRVIYDYDVVFPAKKATFNGKQYNVFHDVDKYLTQVYGDYMKLPPVEKREAHSPYLVDFSHGLSYNTREEYNKLNRK